jgi:peptide/nickel transport system substrate-binding protein
VRGTRRRRTVAMAVAMVMSALALTACTGTEGQESSAAGGRVAFLDYGGFGGGSNPQANYNPFLEATMLQAVFYLYEPLMQYDNYHCEPRPWLATRFDWKDPRTLTFTTRENVKWTDGRAFSAKDVAFTFNLIKKFPPLDTKGVWRYLSAVEASDDTTVTMTFKEPGAPVFPTLNEIRIVPAHIWSTVDDPVTFANAEKPVGTGPFTVKAFNPQQLTIARNPDYWQADKVKVNEIRFHKSDNGGQIDQLRLSRGEYDSNAMFVPDIKKAYVDRDPKHNKYWFPPSAPVSIYMNLTQRPFDDVAFRTALLTAFDRKTLVEKSQLGYVEEASQSGLVIPGQEQWLPDGVADDGKIGYDKDKADAALTAAGYRKDGSGKRLGKDGKPISFTFRVPGAWTDWVQAQKIIVANLNDLGFNVRPEGPTPEAYEADRASGDYQMVLGVPPGSCSMFRNFQEPLASDQTADVGKKAASNFIRWRDRATDGYLDELRRATDEKGQKEAVGKLVGVMMEQAPFIPLWYGGNWFEYRTERAVGWPNEDDPYVGSNDFLPILTHLRPAGDEG